MATMAEQATKQSIAEQPISEDRRAQKCELCEMFLITSAEDFVQNFICSKCNQIKELQDKLIDVHMKLRRMTELNAVLKEASKIQDTFNSTVLIGSAGMGVQNSALLASTLPVQEGTSAEELLPPLISNATVPVVRSSTDSCSTPCSREYKWKRVNGGGKRGICGTRPLQDLKLANRFEVLIHDSPPVHDQIPTSPAPSLPSPVSTVVIGDSIIRGLSLPSHGSKAAVHCFPGAKVLDVNTKLSDVLGKHVNANTVIVHIGSNDTSCRESEILKAHFKTLLISLTNTGKNIAISGPLPAYKRGIEKFSRLLSLNSWLKMTCENFNVIFIDNFDLFWGRPALFRWDGLHPNHRGSHMLAHHIEQHILM
jgi:hypothetical protein